MSIEIHIERLVLDGLPIAGHEASAVRAAMEAELTSLFAEDRGRLGSQRGSTLSSVQGGPIRLAAGVGPGFIGKQIAGAVHAVVRSEAGMGLPLTRGKGQAR